MTGPEALLELWATARLREDGELDDGIDGKLWPARCASCPADTTSSVRNATHDLPLLHLLKRRGLK